MFLAASGAGARCRRDEGDPATAPPQQLPSLPPDDLVGAGVQNGASPHSLGGPARLGSGGSGPGDALSPRSSHRFVGEGLPQPRLEDEIDFLAQELARQEAGHSRLTAPPQPEGRQRLLEAASTLGLSERGRGPNLGLPSTRGAPTPRTSSLRSTVSSGPVHMSPLEPRGGRDDSLALLLIVACSVAGAAALAVAVFCWCR
eukprot:bmy_14834T0